MSTVELIQIEPTSKCNFHCNFCCGRFMDQSSISLEVFKEVIDKFPSVYHIELQGEGEPLMHPELFEMISYANRRNIKISLITNGSLLSAKNINRILDCNLVSLKISLESSDPNDFFKIRGGNLNAIIENIKLLVTERNNRGLKFPSIGFSITLLKSLKEKVLDVADLYLYLGMDGGISIQMLNLMENYIDIYDSKIFDEVLSKDEIQAFWEEYSEKSVVQSIQINKSAVLHFYDELFPNRSGVSLNSERVFRSCPWLDKALYINRHGVATTCCSIKDAGRFSVGKIGLDPIEKILENRNLIGEQVRAGFVPESCRNCRIAESISKRLCELLHKKLLINAAKSAIFNILESGLSRDATGQLFYSDLVLESLLEHSNGKTLVSDMIDIISSSMGKSSREIRSELLPLIDELIRRELAYTID